MTKKKTEEFPAEIVILSKKEDSASYWRLDELSECTDLVAGDRVGVYELKKVGKVKQIVTIV